MEKHDVVIVGGGLAGLSLSKFLAEKGVDFVLLEEHDDFHKKACGEGIGTKINEYRFMDLYDSKKGIEREINEIVIQTKYGKSKIPAPLLMIDKKTVEREFSDQARKKGADIRLNEKVKSIKNDGLYLLEPQKIQAKIIVGADGVFSIVRNFIGVKPPHSAIGVSGICKDIDRDRDCCYLDYNKDIIKYGYIWYFPKKDTWNIGLGSLSNKYFKEAFNNFKNKYAVDSWRGGYGPISKPLKLSKNNVFLVGDAGAQIRSTIGAGNLTSIVSSKILSETLEKITKRNFDKSDAKEYEKLFNQKLGKMLKQEYYITYIIKTLMRNDYLLNMAISKLAKITEKKVKF